MLANKIDETRPYTRYEAQMSQAEHDELQELLVNAGGIPASVMGPLRELTLGTERFAITFKVKIA